MARTLELDTITDPSTTGTANITLSSDTTTTMPKVDINGGAIDATTVGAATPSTVAATAISATGNATVGGTLGVTGNTTVGGTLGVTGNTTVGGTLGVTGAFTSVGIDDNADATAITIDSSENVGIGVVSAKGKLHVRQSEVSGGATPNADRDTFVLEQTGSNVGMSFISDTDAQGQIVWSDTTEFRGALIYDHNGDYMRFDTAGSERMRIDSSGRALIGVGATSNTAALSVIGGAHGNDCMVKIYRNSGTGSHKSGIWFGSNDGTFVTSEAAFIYAANPSNPRATLYFGAYNSGMSASHYINNAIFTGDFNDTSDRGLKDNIAPLESGALELINALNPVKFNWKAGKCRDSENRKIGFIAQELETIIPEAVIGEDYDPDKADDHSEGHNGGKSMNNNAVVSVLTKAVQELSAKVTALESA